MVSSAQAVGAVMRQRPTVITAAVLLGVAIQVVSIPFFFAPGANEIPGFAIAVGIVAIVLTLVGCWGMWNLHKWGGILALVVTFINTITAFPGIFAAPSGWIQAECIALLPLGVVDMVLMALPATWRAYRTR